MRKLIYALEEKLEVDKLIDAEKQANKTGEFDVLYNNIKNDQKQDNESEVTDLSPEEPTDSEKVNTDTESITDESSKDTESSIDETKKPDDAEKDLEIAKEAIQQISIEGWFQDTINIGSSVFRMTADVVAVLKNLALIGLEYTPKAINAFKNVLLLIGKILKHTFDSLELLAKYIKRRYNSYDKLKEDISDIRRIISDLAGETADITDMKYGNVKIINSLKIGQSVDLSNNMAILNKFVKDIVSHISMQVDKDLSATKHIMAYSSSGITKVPMKVMTDNIFTGFLTKKSVENYQPNSQTVISYIYENTLPGDISFISHLPYNNIEELTDLSEAYSQSKMFLGFNIEHFKQVETIDYMTIDDLNKFLDRLDELCDICKQQQSLYENITKKKRELLKSFKWFFNGILTTETKVSLKDSFLDYVYLKTAFIDKVYIVAAMDIHDYSIRVITNGLIYAKENVINITK